MPVKKLKEFLDKEKIKYVSIVHSPAYTAQEVAASAHITGKELAKTVIVHLDGETAMAVLPANRKIVLQDLREVTGSDQVKFVPEDEFKKQFPDCKTGAMPPFGNLYGMEVYAAASLAQNEQIAFNAGSHTDRKTSSRSSSPIARRGPCPPSATFTGWKCMQRRPWHRMSRSPSMRAHIQIGRRVQEAVPRLQDGGHAPLRQPLRDGSVCSGVPGTE